MPHAQRRGATKLGAAIVLALALALPAMPAFQPAPAQAADMIQANLENVLLEDFIKFISQYTGRNIIYRTDQIPQLKFNIYSQKPISEPELMAIFQQVMNNAGLSAVSKENALYIYPLKQAQQIGSTYKDSGSRAPANVEELVTSVYQLRKNISADTAAKALTGLLSPVGQIVALPQAQAVIVTDTQERITNIIDIVRSIESLGSKWDFEVIALEKADSDKVIKVLSNMYKELKDRGEVAEGMPLLASVPWSNSILVSGTREQKRNIREFLGQLDQVSEDDGGLIRVYRLQNADATALAQVLQSLMEARIQKQKENEKITEYDMFKVSADATTNAVVVLTSKDIFPQVEAIITDLDKPMNQVYVEVLVMETSLNNARRFGVEWMVGGGDKNNLGQIGFLDSTSSLMAYADPAFSGDPPAFGALPGGFSMGILGNMITFGDDRFPTVNALINFSKNINEINILSTPQIMTLDHSEAEIFVGENKPFKTGEITQSDSANITSTYDYRDVGIKLRITPHINLTNDLIRLDIYQEVKKSSSVSSTDTSLPTTLTRYTKTSVQLLDGATMVISGLVRDDSERDKVGMPGLANIPVLGWLFKRDSNSFEKTTMMVFVTAHIIRTLDTAKALTDIKQKTIDDKRGNSAKEFDKVFTWGEGDEGEAAGAEPSGAEPSGAAPETKEQ